MYGNVVKAVPSQIRISDRGETHELTRKRGGQTTARVYLCHGYVNTSFCEEKNQILFTKSLTIIHIMYSYQENVIKVNSLIILQTSALSPA